MLTPIPGRAQGQVGWGLEQPALVEDSLPMVGGLEQDLLITMAQTLAHPPPRVGYSAPGTLSGKAFDRLE